MKTVFLITLFFLTTSFFAQDTISASKAQDYIGMVMFVKGKVVSVKAASEGKTTNYINIDRPYPESIFTVVLSNSYLEKQNIKLQDLNQKTICIKGKITTYKLDPKQTPQIFNPESIAVLK
jgi:RPA family protein